jgi:hypothetical protein
MALRAAYALNEGDLRKGWHNGRAMSHALADRYRCHETFVDCELDGPLSTESGYFRFGHDTICYGRTSRGYRTSKAEALLYDARRDLTTTESTLLLPFNPDDIIDNLRLERYPRRAKPSEWNWQQRFLRDAYYVLRPYMPAGIRGYLKRVYANGWRSVAFPHWPVDTTVEQLSEALLLASMKAKGVDSMPFIWFWPGGATSCVVMTHDVEGRPGFDFCRGLMDIDEAYGIKASFQLVPEDRYKVSDDLLREIRDRGFEVNVQDLNHDGYLFADRQEFLHRAARINRYGKIYGAKGFRAAVLYRNADWYDSLDFSYDMSVPNTGHLDPQHGGCCTVLPYFIQDVLEVPLTTTQDYMLFHLLREYSSDLWKSETDIILTKHGLINFLVHPDYVIEKRARKIYSELLGWLRELAGREHLWFALPGEVDEWWRARSKMTLVNRDGLWRIEGARADRAVIAFAKAAGDHIEYKIGSPMQALDGNASTFGPGMVK